MERQSEQAAVDVERLTAQHVYRMLFGRITLAPSI